ncbi:hypothetical protein ACFYZJ_22565 [Streptomyces sp. NPDC001848]|uniref:hypothetical protein n=1 Tax=Streptomyces sp. NPDC001848 TaxID=3364618 RepID=UPI0036C720DE
MVQHEPGVRGADSEGLGDQGIVDVAGDGEGFHPAAGKLDLVSVVGVVDGHDQVAVAGWFLDRNSAEATVAAQAR